METERAVAVTGASGLVGSALTASLVADGVRVLRLVRREPTTDDEVSWHPDKGQIDAARLEGLDAVFHLAGKGIADERWNDRVKREIVASRVEGTQTIAAAIAGLERKPRVLVSASATGFYGNRGDAPVDEDSPPGEGFLAETCRAWENACEPAWRAGVRVVQARIGVVLSPAGGALAKMLPVFRVGGGGVLGSGDQVLSWIALPDLVRGLRFMADTDHVHGAVNATAPGAVTNREFTHALGKKLGRPTLIPAPGFLLKLAMGEMAGPLLLEGARVTPRRLLDAGFVFESPGLEEALDRVLRPARAQD